MNLFGWRSISENFRVDKQKCFYPLMSNFDNIVMDEKAYNQMYNIHFENEAQIAAEYLKIDLKTINLTSLRNLYKKLLCKLPPNEDEREKLTYCYNTVCEFKLCFPKQILAKIK